LTREGYLRLAHSPDSRLTLLLGLPNEKPEHIWPSL
jgi:hypothetical protein